MFRRALNLSCLATAIALLAPSAASAEETCTRSGGVLEINMSEDGDFAGISRGSGGTILAFKSVQGGSGPLECQALPQVEPSVENVDEVRVSDTSGGATTFALGSAGEFVPGATDAGDAGFLNSDEIEMEVDLGSGSGDRFNVAGGDEDDRFVFGESGLNFNPVDGLGLNDSDVAWTGAERLFVSGMGGNDDISAAGDFGTGDALRRRIEIELAGSVAGGTQKATGGAGRDLIQGGPEDDVLDGGAGRDIVDALGGLDTVIGGTGRDSLSGGEAADRLRGSAGPDELLGEAGDDRLIGGGARDAFTGAAGRDSLRARDGARDAKLSCGGGDDPGARFDKRLDPKPRSC